jgi:hypothetical protein
MLNQKQLPLEKITSVILWLVLTVTGIFAQKQQVWLDADTGNEMDDLYAIVRLVKDSTVELVGLSSARVKFPENYMAKETLISNLHTLSIHIQEPALHDSVFRFLTEKLQLPVYYQPLVLGERLYAGLFAGNLVLEPCGPYSNMAYASRDFKAIFFGLTFEPAVSIPDAVRILRERQIDHETGGDEFVFLKDPVLCGENIFISLMDKHDKMRDHFRLDSLRQLMEQDQPGLGIEYVKEIRLGIPDMENLTKWKAFISPCLLSENLVWRMDDKLHFSYSRAPYKEVSSITFKVKSFREAENYLNENKVLFTSEPGLIRIDKTQSFGLLIFLQ